MTTTTYTIAGMTCGHCVQAVTTELSSLEGVTDVTVDLAAGTAAVTSTEPLEAAAVAASVLDAGYEVVD